MKWAILLILIVLIILLSNFIVSMKSQSLDLSHHKIAISNLSTF